MSHPQSRHLARRLLRWALLAFAGATLLGVVAVATLYFLIAPKLPDVETLRDVELQQPMSVYTREGRLMAVFGENRRYPVQIEQVPERLKQAFVAVEDSSFYEHHGVDLVGIARAVWLLATTDDQRVPGGSTITQQVARQFFLSSEYSYKRKLAEMLLAVRMERELSKDEILELYLNKSFFGHRSYGIRAAAEFYYGKELDELSLDEMAALAGIPKFPSSGNPVTNPERALIRRNYILDRMVEEGFVGRAEADRAQSAPMHAIPHEPPIQVYAPYVAEIVRREMVDRFGAEALTRGYHVTTTVGGRLQEAADAALRDGLVTYDLRHGWHGVEQQFELGEDETPAEVGKRLSGVFPQAGMFPAIVLGVEDGVARLVLGTGEVIEIGPDDGWNGRGPEKLELARGDLVRVRAGPEPTASDAPAAPEDEALADAEADAGAQAAPDYKLSQLPRAQAALVSLNPDTGALLALSGGFSFVGSKFNRATQARRQPGSSFKPLLYAAAFERGFNPASIVLDAPVVFRDRAGNTWRPQNDDGEFRGPMRLREALVQSRNLVSVRLLDAIGVDYARRYISHFGFELDNLPPNLSMSLGTASLTPMSMARAYAVFANGGYRIEPWVISQVKDRDGAVVYEAEPAVACRDCTAGSTASTGSRASQVVDGFNLGPALPAPEPEATTGADGRTADAEPPANIDELQLAPRAMDARIAYQVVSMLRDVVKRGTGTKARVLGREDVGGKTGSTNDYRDAWFSGLADNVVTTVWVGRDDFQSLGRGEYGGRAALPIWIDYMRAALEDRPVAANEPPEGMVQVQVAANGSLLPEGASGGVAEWIKVEDLERMRSYARYDAEAEAEAAAEETFDIF